MSFHQGQSCAPPSQRLLDLAAHAAAIGGIQRGLQGISDGTGEDADDAFASLERELGLADGT